MDKLQVTQADRDAVWPYRPNCYKVHDYTDWMAGKYDNVAKVIQAFAAHRTKAEQARGDVVAFQNGVDKWMDACFGDAIKADKVERCDRFIEEALEFVQAVGYSAERAHALVDYVFGRDVGEVNQEVGGVMVTLAAACNTIGVDIGAAAQTELARVWTKVEAIRAKQAAKPTGSALPVATTPPAPDPTPKVDAMRERETLAVLQTAHESELAMQAKIDALREENARLRKMLVPQWFYADGYSSEDCHDSPCEVIEYLDLNPGKHVISVDCAGPMPSIWCAITVLTDEQMDEQETDDRVVFTEHASEEEARQALGDRP